MTTRIKFSRALKSRSIAFVLLGGNLILALTSFMQARTIQNQKQLIHVLYRDSVELTSFKIAAVAAAHKR